MYGGVDMSGGASGYFIGLLGVVSGLTIGLMVGRRGDSEKVMMSPAPDNKTEQAYRRSGFGDRLMSIDRRNQLSECYKTMLRNNGYDENSPTPKPGVVDGADTPGFEGKVTFVFHVGEDGTMLSFELIDSEFSDTSFGRCLTKAIEGTRFLPPPLGINRYLAYDFVFKSDETYKKEMEERKNQAPLLLVTPTPAAAVGAPPTPASGSNPPPPPPPLPPSK
jgi:hypothetical protein